jgi:hypothetical protein
MRLFFGIPLSLSSNGSYRRNLAAGGGCGE